MNRFLVDLHVHTALSPCASDAMTPCAIVAEALALGLHVLAICDHNSAANARAVQLAARDRLAVLAGLEITTAEEVHVLGIFPAVDDAMNVSDRIRQTLPDLDIPNRIFGRQLRMDESGAILVEEKKMLAFATPFSLEQTVELVKSHRGLAIASHIDRPSFGVISQLGFFPDDVRFDALEVTPRGLSSPQAALYISLKLPIITSSDSHELTDLGVCYSMFEMRSPTFDEIARALAGEGDRRVFYHA